MAALPNQGHRPPAQCYHVVKLSISQSVMQLSRGHDSWLPVVLLLSQLTFQLSIPALWQLPHYFCLLHPVPAGEAIHLGSLIAAQGYVFPISDHVLALKDDGTFYRFQVGPPVPPPEEPVFLIILWSQFRTTYKYWGHLREQPLPPTSSGKIKKTFVWAIYCFAQTIQKRLHGNLLFTGQCIHISSLILKNKHLGDKYHKWENWGVRRIIGALSESER